MGNMPEGEQIQHGGQQTVYQMSVLNASLVESLVKDDSPEMIENWLWSVFGVDIPVADIKDYDFKNILDMVDIELVNKLQNEAETNWDNLAVVEYVIDPETFEPKPVRYFLINDLWDSIRLKVYIKMCRSRDGMTFKGLTENRTISDTRFGGNMIPQGYAPAVTPPTQSKKHWWKPF